MGQPKAPRRVKLIVSAFAPGDALLQQARGALDIEWGPIDFESELLPFDHTPYYEPEFGADLVRRIWTFEPLVDPGTLAMIKLRTNELEGRWAANGRRRAWRYQRVWQGTCRCERPDRKVGEGPF